MHAFRHIVVAAGVVFSVCGVCYAGPRKYRAEWVPCARGGVTPGNDFGPTRGAVLCDMLSRCPAVEDIDVRGAYHSCQVAGPGHGCLPWECCVLVGNVVGSVVSQLLSCDRPHVVMA